MATGTTNVGFEEKLWSAADKLRSNMDAAEYKHVVLGLIFLKYVSDVRRHIVGGANRTLISVLSPLRLCRTGTCRRLQTG